MGRDPFFRPFQFLLLFLFDLLPLYRRRFLFEELGLCRLGKQR
jgi:hypothetical protein